MISKEEAKAKLRKAGYTVVDDNSVITVIISEKGNIKNTVKAVKEIFIKNDYQSSFGVRQSSSSLSEENEEYPDSEQSEIEIDSDKAEVLESLGEETESDVEPVKLTETIDDIDIQTKKTVKKKSNKSVKTKETKVEEDEFFDDEDDLDSVDGKIELDSFDMDMLLNEDSVQFSLDDFGLM